MFEVKACTVKALPTAPGAAPPELPGCLKDAERVISAPAPHVPPHAHVLTAGHEGLHQGLALCRWGNPA